MRIFIIRHGESIGNKHPRIYFEKNDCDIELTEKGEQDAVSAADKIYEILHGFHMDKSNPGEEHYGFNLVHSTYLRATQTANIISTKLNMNDGYNVERISSTPLCREREWGSLRDIVESKMKTDQHFNFYYRPVNGESFADAYQRAVLFHQNLVATSVYRNNIVVAHGEFNKVYLMYLLGWNIEEFEKFANQRNGEVWLVENNQLSSLTPLRESTYSRKNK